MPPKVSRNTSQRPFGAASAPAPAWLSKPRPAAIVSTSPAPVAVTVAPGASVTRSSDTSATCAAVTGACSVIVPVPRVSTRSPTGEV